MPPSIQKMHLLVPLAAKSIHYKIRYGSNPSVFFQPPFPVPVVFSARNPRGAGSIITLHTARFLWATPTSPLCSTKKEQKIIEYI
ncbi:hypothetical protein CEXT_720931 [Caerostris extrusa]|uniref:Uncharacterized protein n=1 Tax=Caerostris extrusa TaxID=172846 RepID=A0AAV4M887_CAEEX|nr:hypothetical protein CEXT_720931 [Caerostris extrusa]